MEINLEEESIETSYYYAEDGKTVGPFPLNELLPKIKADTLVYRDGIEWTNARDVEELRAHFPEPEKKPKNSFLLLIISILLFALIGAGTVIFYNKMNKTEPPKEEATGGKTGIVSPENTESPTTTGSKVSTESGNAPAIGSKSETGSSGNDKGTNNGSESENPSQPKTKKSPSSPKQVELFTCESGQNIRKTLVNNGACDCNDCSDESGN